MGLLKLHKLDEAFAELECGLNAADTRPEWGPDEQVLDLLLAACDVAVSAAARPRRSREFEFRAEAARLRATAMRLRLAALYGHEPPGGP